MRLYSVGHPDSFVNAQHNVTSLIRRDSIGERSGSREQTIGAILLDAGLINDRDVDQILSHAVDTNQRFGDAAVGLGLVSAAQLHQALAYQFNYPVVPRTGSTISNEVLAAFGSNHPIVDELRKLRNQILLRWLSAEDTTNRILALVSQQSGDGRSFVAANLAVTFAQMGHKTLLVDADLRRPRQHRLFGLDNSTGLSAILAGRGPSMHRVELIRNLAVLTSGGVPPNPSELIAGTAFAASLERYAKLYDIVLLDTPAAYSAPEAQVIAAKADGCVLVAREGISRFDQLQEMVGDLQNLKCHIVGSILMRR